MTLQEANFAVVNCSKVMQLVSKYICEKAFDLSDKRKRDWNRSILPNPGGAGARYSESATSRGGEGIPRAKPA